MDAAIRRLAENQNLAFVGDGARGRRGMTAVRARRLLALHNPHGKPNSDVLRPWIRAADILQHPRDLWTVDFPPGMDEREAALYTQPYAETHRRKGPVSGRRHPAGSAFGLLQADMRVALARRDRFLATPVGGRHRVFVWLPPEALPDRSLVAFARDDDWFLGVLHSRCHEVWARHYGARSRSAAVRYTPDLLETFPFPWPPATPLGKLTRLQDEQRSAIALAAAMLHARRCAWLNETPNRRRTLAALYDRPPEWLLEAHAALDLTVTAAYGWSADLSDEDLIGRLRDLNRDRASGA